MSEELLSAKKHLYALILQKENCATKNELDIVMLLTKDGKIQELFEKNKF